MSDVMDVIARDERSWTLRACPICGAATVDPDDYVCQCVCALEAVEVVPSTALRGAVEALDEAVTAARTFNRNGLTWLEYDALLVRLEQFVNHARGR